MMDARDLDGNQFSLPVSGAGEAFGANLRYLIAFPAPGGLVRIRGRRATDPLRILTEDPAATHVLMPMGLRR